MSYGLTQRQRTVLTNNRRSALAVAAELGREQAVAALLAAGADPNRGTSSSSALEVACSQCRLLPEQDALSMIRQLLAAGADATRCSSEVLMQCAKAHRSVGRLLLARLRQPSVAGDYPLPLSISQLLDLLCAAALADSVECLEHFASKAHRVQPMGYAANAVLANAVGAGSMRVLHFVLRASQAAVAAPPGAAEPSSWAAQMFGPSLHPGASWLLQSAAACGQPAAVQLLLLQTRLPVTADALLAAVRSGSWATLRALLDGGKPEILDTFALPSRTPLVLSSWHNIVYPCPILAALQARTRQAELDDALHWRTLRQPDQRVVHPCDVRLLPLVELLVAAGYRPTVFRDVAALKHQHLRVLLFARFDRGVEDARLDVKGVNRWLWMAAQQPAWPPASCQPSISPHARCFWQHTAAAAAAAAAAPGDHEAAAGYRIAASGLPATTASAAHCGPGSISAVSLGGAGRCRHQLIANKAWIQPCSIVVQG